MPSGSLMRALFSAISSAEWLEWCASCWHGLAVIWRPNVHHAGSMNALRLDAGEQRESTNTGQLAALEQARQPQRHSWCA